MPKRKKCCTTCNYATCNPALMSSWANDFPNVGTYSTTATTTDFVNCPDTARVNFDLTIGMRILETDGSYYTFWNDFAGHFSWTHTGGNGQYTYDRDWEFCEGQSEYPDAAGFVCDSLSDGMFSYCFGAPSFAEAGCCSECACGEGMETEPCNQGGTGASLAMGNWFGSGTTHDIDADWYQTGIEIWGDTFLFDPTGNGDSCGATGDYYQRQLRKITLQPSHVSTASFRITWYFTGNPTNPGAGTPLCYYRDYVPDTTNQFGEYVENVNAQNQYGFRATGGGTTLWADVRIEDGDTSKVYDITNGKVMLYYKKPFSYRYVWSFTQTLGCYKDVWEAREGHDCPHWHSDGTAHCIGHCQCKDCCGEVVSSNWCVGLGTISSPTVQITTSDQSVDRCPQGSDFGGTWSFVAATSPTTYVTNNGCSVA